MERLAPILRKTTPRYCFTIWASLDPQPPDYQPAPLDLTGGTVTLRAKVSPEADATLLFSVACTPDDDPRSGKCWVRLTETQTDHVGVLYYELRAVFASGPRARQSVWVGSFLQPIRETLV